MVAFVVLRKKGLGGMAERFVVDGLEPFNAFPTLKWAIEFLRRHVYRGRHPGGLRDLTNPAWTLSVKKLPHHVDTALEDGQVDHTTGKTTIGDRWLIVFPE